MNVIDRRKHNSMPSMTTQPMLPMAGHVHNTQSPLPPGNRWRHSDGTALAQSQRLVQQQAFSANLAQPLGFFKAGQGWLSPLTKLVGTGGGVMGVIGAIMSVIEANELTKLFVSDVGAMVIPRTASELKQRGVDAARETGIREISGTITNVYLVGWLAFMALWGFKSLWSNPKGMSLKAWVDAPTLDEFGQMAKQVFDEAKHKGLSGQQLQKRFLHKALARIESTDGIAHQAEFQKYLPFKGRLNPQTRESLVDILLGKIPGFGHKVHEVEAEVVKKLHLAEHQTPIEVALEKVEGAFRKARGLIIGQPLSERQNQELWRQMLTEKRTLTQQLRRKLRLTLTGEIRNTEKPFIEKLYRMAIHSGGLSDEIYMLDRHGKLLTDVGAKSTKRYLSQLKFFMEEFFNRSLAHPDTGQVGNRLFNRDTITMAQHQLFGRPGLKQSLIQRLIPSLEDGLLSYAYKCKRLIIAVPLLIAMGIGASMVIINNNITRKKHGGKTFFPGEVALSAEEGFQGHRRQPPRYPQQQVRRPQSNWGGMR